MDSGSATPTAGTPVTLPTYTDTDGTSGHLAGYIQAIAADRISGIWITGSTIFSDGIGNNVYRIAYGSGDTVTPVAVTLAASASMLSGAFCRLTDMSSYRDIITCIQCLALRFNDRGLRTAGSGDLTGYITAQLKTPSARYTYIHDTGITGVSQSLQICAPSELSPRVLSCWPRNARTRPCCRLYPLSYTAGYKSVFYPIIVLSSICPIIPQATAIGTAASWAGRLTSAPWLP